MGASGQTNWRVDQNATDWFMGIEKRMMHEERRPTVTAESLLGIGIAPLSSRVYDWNDELLFCNGFWYSEPGAISSPDGDPSAKWYLGRTQADEDGFGVQWVTEYRAADDIDGDPVDTLTWPNPTYTRRFYVPAAGGQTTFSDWEEVAGGGGGTPGPRGTGGQTFTYSGTLPTVFTGTSRWYNDTGVTLTLTSIRASLDTAGSTTTTVDVNKNGTTVFTNPAHRPSLSAGVVTDRVTTIDVATLDPGEFLTVDIDAGGTGAVRLTVQVEAL